MRAVTFHEHGGVEVLKYEDVPEPKLKSTEVLIRVRACATVRSVCERRGDSCDIIGAAKEEVKSDGNARRDQASSF